MPNYVPYHIIFAKYEGDTEFTKWLGTVKDAFHERYPNCYLQLDERNIGNSRYKGRGIKNIL